MQYDVASLRIAMTWCGREAKKNMCTIGRSPERIGRGRGRRGKEIEPLQHALYRISFYSSHSLIREIFIEQLYVLG